MSQQLPSDLKALLDSAPRHIRRSFNRSKYAAAQIENASGKDRRRALVKWSRRFGVSIQTLMNRQSEWRQKGDIALFDRRWSAAAWQRKTAPVLKADTVRARRARNVIWEVRIRLYANGQVRIVKTGRNSPPRPAA